MSEVIVKIERPENGLAGEVHINLYADDAVYSVRDIVESKLGASVTSVNVEQFDLFAEAVDAGDTDGRRWTGSVTVDCDMALIVVADGHSYKASIKLKNLYVDYLVGFSTCLYDDDGVPHFDELDAQIKPIVCPVLKSGTSISMEIIDLETSESVDVDLGLIDAYNLFAASSVFTMNLTSPN